MPARRFIVLIACLALSGSHGINFSSGLQNLQDALNDNSRPGYGPGPDDGSRESNKYFPQQRKSGQFPGKSINCLSEFLNRFQPAIERETNRVAQDMAHFDYTASGGHKQSSRLYHDDHCLSEQLNRRKKAASTTVLVQHSSDQAVYATVKAKTCPTSMNLRKFSDICTTDPGPVWCPTTTEKKCVTSPLPPCAPWCKPFLTDTEDNEEVAHKKLGLPSKSNRFSASLQSGVLPILQDPSNGLSSQQDVCNASPQSWQEAGKNVPAQSFAEIEKNFPIVLQGQRDILMGYNNQNLQSQSLQKMGYPNGQMQQISYEYPSSILRGQMGQSSDYGRNQNSAMEQLAMGSNRNSAWQETRNVQSSHVGGGFNKAIQMLKGGSRADPGMKTWQEFGPAAISTKPSLIAISK